jgi:hypothetical protein
LNLTVGTVWIERWKISEAGEGDKRRYSFLLHRMWKTGEKTAPGLRKRVVELTTERSYEQSGQELARGRTGRLSRMTLWRITQREGQRYRHEKQRRIAECLEGTGEVVPREKRAAIVIEADGTVIPSRKGKGKRIEANVGIAYSRKEDRGKNGRRRRMHLADKVVVGGIGSREEEWAVEEFGRELWYETEKNFGVGEARTVLYQTDGARGLKNIQEMHFPQAKRQLDIWHVLRRSREVLGSRVEDLKKILRLIYRKRIEEAVELLMGWAAVACSTRQREELVSLAGYLGDNRTDILRFRGLLKGADPDLKRLLVSGTGAIEKNVDLVVVSRFKKRGMKWSRNGAANLLSLRALKLNPRDWNEHWALAGGS